MSKIKTHARTKNAQYAVKSRVFWQLWCHKSGHFPLKSDPFIEWNRPDLTHLGGHVEAFRGPYWPQNGPKLASETVLKPCFLQHIRERWLWIMSSSCLACLHVASPPWRSSVTDLFLNKNVLKIWLCRGEARFCLWIPWAQNGLCWALLGVQNEPSWWLQRAILASKLALVGDQKCQKTLEIAAYFDRMHIKLVCCHLRSLKFIKMNIVHLYLQQKCLKHTVSRGGARVSFIDFGEHNWPFWGFLCPDWAIFGLQNGPSEGPRFE